MACEQAGGKTTVLEKRSASKLQHLQKIEMSGGQKKNEKVTWTNRNIGRIGGICGKKVDSQNEKKNH